jgi:hypothetical protein
LYSFDIMPIRATYPAHPILLDLDSLIMFGEGRNCCVFRLLFSPASCHILTPRSKYYRDAEIVVNIRYWISCRGSRQGVMLELWGCTGNQKLVTAEMQNTGYRT